MITTAAYYFTHLSELFYLLQMKREFEQYKPSQHSLVYLSQSRDDLDYCYEALKKVSRSFSIVIQQLPQELRTPVCLFYLILRGLDTIEDDMNLDQKEKEKMLLSFADRINGQPFNLENVGDTKDYRELMLHFDKILREYQRLSIGYQKVITEITGKMAEGMLKYSHKVIETYADWDEYCHYVAGLVGIGLTQLFLGSGLENNATLKDLQLSNEMGLFLQKTNIIRDFAEDLEQGRIFWSEETWKNKVENLLELQENKERGLAALNEVVINALGHIPACLKFLGSLENPMVFRFCAIPQLMAIATLKKLYNNADALHKNVKIRRGRMAKYFISIKDFEGTKKEFVKVLHQLDKKDKTGKISLILKQIQ